MLSDTKRQKSDRKKGRFQPANGQGGRKLREAKQFFLKKERIHKDMTAKHNPSL